jgi:hypothetical protein
MWAFWFLLIALEVIARASSWVLVPGYVLSIVAMAVGTFWAVSEASSAEGSAWRELGLVGLGVLSFLLTLLVGVVLGVNFKFLIGGSL